MLDLSTPHARVGFLILDLVDALESANTDLDTNYPTAQTPGYKKKRDEVGELERIVAAAEVLELRIRKLGELPKSEAILPLDYYE